MTYRKRIFRGAISIFLVIILISNYALVGLLVDSGRQRMAKASAEMALDTAAASVLSYYDKMLYDLYGLFATDSLSNDKIESLLADYVQKTLGTTHVEQSEAKKLTDTIVSAIFGQDGQRVDSILFDGYDYQFESPAVKFDDSNSVSLAYTDAVEAQIIDHMKYRAPMVLAGEVGGFLEDLNAILAIGDRIDQTIAKLQETEDDKKKLAKDANSLMNDIGAYNKKVLVFSSCGYEIMSSEQNRSLSSLQESFSSPYDPWKTIDILDRKFNEIGNQFDPVDPDDEDYETKVQEQRDKLRRQYEQAYDSFLDDWNGVGDIAYDLHSEANSLRTRADQLNTNYTNYIAKMQAKIDADPDNENLKTLYLPEIELAEATCGEALKNMYLVLTGRQYCLELYNAFRDNRQEMGGFTSNFIEGAVSNVISNRMGENPGATTASLRSYINIDPPNVFAQDAKDLMDRLTNDFQQLFNEADSYNDPNDIELKTTTEPKANSITKKADEEKPTLRDLDSNALSVDFKNASDLDKEWECSLSDSMKTENTVALLQAGKNLLNAISNVLNNARDSLYINEYIIAYFPNYVQHYNTVNSTDKDSVLAGKNSKLISDKSYYAPFNASQAELEYVLSGNPDASVSVLSASAKLTAVRMVFNTIAIFTDSAKISQANSLALAISGPFAPLVSITLLVAWALAESALDTIDLLDGKEVLVFKQGSDWTISLEGGIKKLVGKAVNYVSGEVTEAINKKIDEAGGAVSSIANKAVYDAYQYASKAAGNVDSAVDTAVSQAKGSLNGWSREVASSIGANNSTAMMEFQSAASGAIDSSFSVPSASSMVTDVKDKVLLQIDKGVGSAEKSLKKQTKELTKKYGDQFTDWASKGLQKYFEKGNAINTGSSDPNKTGMLPVKMDYLDYMRIFLMFYGNEYKVKRIQELVQANIRYGANAKEIESHKQFSMASAYMNINATMDSSISYMFMSNAILPESLKMNGRMKVSVTTDRSY